MLRKSKLSRQRESPPVELDENIFWQHGHVLPAESPVVVQGAKPDIVVATIPQASPIHVSDMITPITTAC